MGKLSSFVADGLPPGLPDKIALCVIWRGCCESVFTFYAEHFVVYEPVIVIHKPLSSLCVLSDT